MKKNKIVIVLSVLFLMLTSYAAQAQVTILVPAGGDNVNVGETWTYIAKADKGVTIISGSWTVTGGTVDSQSNTSATITWTTAGSQQITYTGNTFNGPVQKIQNVTVNAVSGPSAPSNPTITSHNCTSATLTRGTPPTGVTWYWQGTNSTGTSTSNSSTTYTVTGSGTYYIRARDNGSGVWSTGSGLVSVTMGSVGGTTYYQDQDGDGKGDPYSFQVSCTQPSGYVSDNSDQCPTDYSTEPNGCPIGTTPTLSDENYVHTIVPQVASTDVTTLNPSEKIESVTYFDGLGRAKQQIAIRGGGVVLNNSANYDWTLGNTGSTSFYNRNGNTSENTIVNGTTPFGDTDLLWECKPDASNNADGGWKTDYFSVNHEEGYRFSVWVKRTGNMNGTTFHGVQNVNNLSGSFNSNPYFITGHLPQIDQWYLMVGIVHPSNYTGGDSGISGMYDVNGNKVKDGTEYKWASTTTTTRMRDYLHYCTDTSVRQYFWNPVIQKLNGSELSLEELIDYSKLLEPDMIPNDIVTHIEYDDLGRTAQQFLPYSSFESGGAIKTNAKDETLEYHLTKYADDFAGVTLPADVNAYSEKAFESSPLNRVIEQTAPGKDWKMGSSTIAGKEYSDGKSIRMEYGTNTSTEVRRYYVTTTFANNTYYPTLQESHYYAANQLMKSVTKDENWTVADGLDKTTEEFKNKSGQVVLKRTYNNGQKHNTYYVYDDFGNLIFVIPPKVTTGNGVSATERDELCYQYKYDHRNRLVEKKIPGKGWEYIVYDKLDRPVMTQDAIQASASPKEWLYTKYDALGRVAYTGIHKDFSNRSRTSMQSYFYTAPRQGGGTSTLYETRHASEFSSSYVQHHYTNLNFPYQNIEILTVNYYDDYIFNLAGGSSTMTAYTVTSESTPTGYPTGTKTKVLGTTSTYRTDISYYDNQGRSIGSYHKNPYLNTSDVISNKLDFTGKLLETNTAHTNTSDSSLGTQNVKDVMTYDHMGRLTKQTQTLNSAGATEVIVENVYDEMGQLIQKGVGGTTSQDRLQDVNYIHNIRGWLRQINDPSSIGSDMFAFKINYNSVDHSGTKLYNGNIAETEWKTKNDNVLRWYRYNYDDLNRITSATDNSNNYNLSGLTYDKNGNILTLQRKGHNGTNVISGFMDNLTYTYGGNDNKLTSVADGGDANHGFKNGANSSNEYTYDANGNMKKDLNKGILSITYNHLNLPTKVFFNSGRYIDYVYDATGAKLKKIVTDNSNITTTMYAGGFVYKNNNELQFFSTSEGYFNKTGVLNGDVQGDYVYQYKDHLGNIRLSYADSDHNGSIDEDTEIIEQSHYYPFGLKHKGYNNAVSSNGNSVAQKFGYNNKELEESLGLNLLEYGARNYDASTGRFFNIDRYSESFMPISNYQYGANNPMLYIDYNGDYITIGISDKDGNKYSVLYENGRAYHYSKNKDGKIVKGDEYDGDSEFVKDAISDLGKISDTKQGRRIIGKLQQSSDGYNIVNSGNNISPTFNFLNNNILYNPNKKYGTHDGVSFNKSYINLGHELAHAYDKDRGFDMTSTALGGLPASEINAVMFENYLRAHDGQSKMRLQYKYGNNVYNLRGSFGGRSAQFFKSFIVPLGRNEVRRLLIPIRDRSNDFQQRDITNVRPPYSGKTGIFDTKQQKFISFE